MNVDPKILVVPISRALFGEEKRYALGKFRHELVQERRGRSRSTDNFKSVQGVPRN